MVRKLTFLLVFFFNQHLLSCIACGGRFKNSIRGDFSSPKYPQTSPLNAYCMWTIEASAGNLMSLEIRELDIAR